MKKKPSYEYKDLFQVVLKDAPDVVTMLLEFHLQAGIFPVQATHMPGKSYSGIYLKEDRGAIKEFLRDFIDH